MRIAVLILGLVLLATPVSADVDYSVSLDVSSGDGYWYFSNGNWHCGDATILQGISYNSAGLSIGIRNGDWGAHFNTANQQYYPYSSGYHYQPVQHFDSIITPLEPMIEPYTGRTNRVPGRTGYSVAIPRGLGGEPELYGDYVYDERGRPVPADSQNYGYNYNQGRSNRYGNRPLVLHYSLGYPYYNNYPMYSAPSNPDYGYTGGYRYPVNDPILYGGDRQEVRAEEYNVYQGDVYNYYYDEAKTPPAPELQPTAQDATPAGQQAVSASIASIAYGTRFYEVARMETPDGVLVFSLKNGNLSVGPENGPSQQISDLADPQLGAYASYTDVAGVVVLFVRGSRIAAAYPVEDGSWWVEPLPYALDLSGKTTLGLVGDAPWAVFNSKNGNRYVMMFVDHQWQEIGSGTT